MKDENVQRQQKAAEVAGVEPMPEEGISTSNEISFETKLC